VKFGRAIFPLVLFGGLFFFFTWIIAVPDLRILVFQHRAESFPAVRGEVLSGGVTVTRGNKGSVHYHPWFLYTYEVAGQNYSGRRFRYDGHPAFSQSAPAERI
jgi:Protein of unknown function (DUF3592)